MCNFEEANPRQTMTRALAMQIKNDDVSNESTPFVNMLFNDFWCVRWGHMMTCHDVIACLKLLSGCAQA